MKLSDMASGDPKYWVSGTPYAVGKTVRSPSDHQRYVRVIAGSGATDPAGDATNWRPDGGRAIKSIQRGITTKPLSSSEWTDVTIASVVPSKTIVNLLSSSVLSSGSYDNWYMQQVSLLNATTLRVYGRLSLYDSTNGYRYTGAPVSWEIVEYY